MRRPARSVTALNWRNFFASMVLNFAVFDQFATAGATDEETTVDKKSSSNVGQPIPHFCAILALVPIPDSNIRPPYCELPGCAQDVEHPSACAETD
jgi:hypothetical protein